MTGQSLAAFRQVFTVQPQKTEKDARAFLITTARNGIQKITADQTARVGIAPSVEVYANTPANKVLESVKLPGPIVARFDYRREVALFALDAVRKASPVTSGEYVKNHVMLLNGAEVDVLPANLSPTDVITITNPVEYARRLEIGKTKSGRDFVQQVPNRIYERVAKKVVSGVYRNVAKITFTYLELSGAYAIGGKGGKAGLTPTYTVGEFGPGGKHRQRKRRQKVGSKVRAPAIEIRSL
jgi:hypothetical protein